MICPLAVYLAILALQASKPSSQKDPQPLNCNVCHHLCRPCSCPGILPALLGFCAAVHSLRPFRLLRSLARPGNVILQLLPGPPVQCSRGLVKHQEPGSAAWPGAAFHWGAIPRSHADVMPLCTSKGCVPARKSFAWLDHRTSSNRPSLRQQRALSLKHRLPILFARKILRPTDWLACVCDHRRQLHKVTSTRALLPSEGPRECVWRAGGRC